VLVLIGEPTSKYRTVVVMDPAWNASGLNAAINTAVAHRGVNVSGFAGALLNAPPAA
jgi:hypothetical protein